ncbi:transcription factor TFIIIB component B'' homolog isoform X2 [Echeneis naucrates]|uniref:transcription factor TFIIIB component B'' homolog isoform X2 n=1 Tax=Echeneis naucrates TaxID=173247 RepID=UPI0011136B7A|nr:transcription factor TFIIIB component B'' homolog isoform X2 [Echeneis naucrates]
MFRRSRFSVRPNVGTTGRTAAATPQEATSANQEASETPRDVSENSIPPVTDTNSAVTPSEKPSDPGDCNDQNGEGTSSSAAVQRRKRFSVKPKVAPGRPSTLSRTPKSLVKAASETPVEVPGSDLDKPTTSSHPRITATPLGLQSPKRGRPSLESRRPNVQSPPTSISSDSLGPSAVPLSKASPQLPDIPKDSVKQLESKKDGQVKDIPPRPPDKVPLSLPDRESVELSEKAKTLVSLKSGHSLSRSAFCLSRLLNDPSDLQRLAKAQKLRDLLRQERHKEKKLKKAKARPKEITLDPSKMTMRDLIRYLPESNPMSTSLEESAQENETVVPPSPTREESPERATEPEVHPKPVTGGEDEEAAEEEEEESLMVPQVKVAEDGSLIIDEESLTVEVQRAKGPNPAQDRDPIFERGSTTTYSSFRKGNRAKPWSSEETDMFFLAISMVGTDFSMICQLFPHRARSEIKNKFKKEERENSWRIDKAFRERRKLDIEYFSKLLEKVLEFQKNRKKLKKLSAENAPKKQKKKSKGKKAAKKLSDVEEEDEEDDNEVLDLADENEGEKENEDLCNEGGILVSKPKQQCKKKTRQAAPIDEPNGKKNQTGEACTPEETEAALPEVHTSSDMSTKTENAKELTDTAIKPAKLSRGRAPKPLLPLGRKWGKKAPAPSTQAKDTASDKGDENMSDGATKEQVNEDSSPTRQGNKRKSPIADSSSEEEDAAVQPPKPTRYGRMPKPTNPLNYPAKEDPHTTASDRTPTSPMSSTLSDAKPKPKSSTKRGRSSKQKSTQEPKKPKLVTLRATEYTDEEDEQDHEEIEEEEIPACSPSKDGVAPVFVPASLRSPQPVISEVEETMEELDILANMPDVLGISQDALCPDASCEQALNERGTAEPCEHQLDLLVDVIDFLSSEHTEVSEDKSYNEAAQTLLAIGNPTHLPQSVQNQIETQDYVTGTTSVSVIEIAQHLEEECEPKPAEQEENTANGVTETPQTISTMEPQSTTTDHMCGEQKNISDVGPNPPLQPEYQSHCSYDAQFEPCGEQASRDAQSKSESSAEKVICHTEIITSCSNNSTKSGTFITEAQVEQVLNTDSVPDVGVSASFVTTVDLPVSQKAASKVTATCQPRRSRLQKVKPKPNLSQTSRTARSTAQTMKDSVEICQDHEKSVTEVESEATCSTYLPRTSENISAASVLGSALGPTAEPSTAEEKRTGVDLGQVYAASKDNIHFEPSSRGTGSLSESTDEKETASDAIIESHPNLVTSDTAAVRESSGRPALCVNPVDIAVSQEEESEAASISRSRRSRLPKVKPKPNISQTSRAARSTTQNIKDSVEKDCSSTPVSQENEKPITAVEPEATCCTSPQKTSENICAASAFMIGSALTPTREPSATEEKKTDVGFVGEVNSITATSDQSASENQSLSKDLFERCNRDTESISESRDEKETANNGTTDRRNNLVASDSAVTVSQAGQTTAVIHESGNQPATCGQKTESKAASAHQVKRGRLQKVKPKPNLAQTSRGAQSKPQTANTSSPKSKPQSTDNRTAEAEPIYSVILPTKSGQSTGTVSGFPSLETCTSESTAELPSSVEQKTDAGLDSSSQSSEPTVPKLRRSFSKVKPNLGSSTRTAQTKLQLKSKPSNMHMNPSHVTSEPQPIEDSQTELKLAEEDGEHSTATHCENRSNEESTVVMDSSVDKMSNNDTVEAEPSSQEDLKLDMPTKEANTLSPDGHTSVSDVLSAEEGSTESKINPALAADADSISDPKGSSPTLGSETGSELKSKDAAQQCSETREMDQTSKTKAQSDQSSDDGDLSSKKAPQTRRGRLIKPKPNLGRSSRPPQTQQAQKTKVETGDGNEPASHKPKTERRPGNLEPAEGAIEPHSSQEASLHEDGSLLGCLTEIIEHLSQPDSSTNDAGSSLGCVKQVQDDSFQNMSTLSTEGTQTHPTLAMFPGMLSEQVPSDPDEPFFILSLTEIPVCSSGQVVDSAAEPLPYLHAADASIQQHSESLTSAGDGSPLHVSVPVSMEERGDTGLDPAAHTDSVMANPVDPHEGTSVQPPKFPETLEKNDETEIPPSKQKSKETGRRAKLQVRPNTTRKKQASKIPAKKTNRDSELPGASSQPEAADATTIGDNEVVSEPQKRSGDTEEESLVGGDGPEDHSSGAHPQTKSKTTSVRKRTASSSDPSPGKASSKSGEPKTPHATRNLSNQSTSRCVVPTPNVTQLPHYTPSTSSTATLALTEVAIAYSHSTAEVSASHQSDHLESNSTEEEPTSVSQYFLSDIFTEVDEG